MPRHELHPDDLPEDYKAVAADMVNLHLSGLNPAERDSRIDKVAKSLEAFDKAKFKKNFSPSEGNQ